MKPKLDKTEMPASTDNLSRVGLDAGVRRPRFSLHRTRTPKECQLCSCVVPVRQLPDYAEYWRVKGGDRLMPKIICCWCHALYGLPTDGWDYAPDGVETISAATPALGRGTA